MNQDEYTSIMEQTGADLEELPTKEGWRVMQQWREVFAAPYHAATRKWKRGKYEWHIFSFKDTKSVDRKHAMKQYERQSVERFFVVPEGEHLTAYFCIGGSLPNFRSLAEDIYVWPEDLSWTMAFTHEMEPGLGPYFCLREWVT